MAVQEGPLAEHHADRARPVRAQDGGFAARLRQDHHPVHVVDKATKLQTLYDRIGLVETRVEVLKRDAELAALRRQLALRPVADAAAEASIQQALQQELTALDEDRDFCDRREPRVEAMSPADQQRCVTWGATPMAQSAGVQTSFLTADGWRTSPSGRAR